VVKVEVNANGRASAAKVTTEAERTLINGY